MGIPSTLPVRILRRQLAKWGIGRDASFRTGIVCPRPVGRATFRERDGRDSQISRKTEAEIDRFESPRHAS
jgi:hypothetical protein